MVIVVLALVVLGALIFIFRGDFRPIDQDQPFVPNDNEVSLDVYFVNREMMAEGTAAYEEMVQPVSRTVLFNEWGAEKALRLLLAGPILAESDTFDTSIPAGTRLNSLRVEEGTAYADFSQELGQVAGSATVIPLREQINRTLKQFPGILEVIITVQGESSEEMLQP